MSDQKIKTMEVPLDYRDKQSPMITNTMKQYCIGEYSFEIADVCTACHFDEPDPDCEVCGGEVEFRRKVTVPWNTCKKIYKQMATMANGSQRWNWKEKYNDESRRRYAAWEERGG